MNSFVRTSQAQGNTFLGALDSVSLANPIQIMFKKWLVFFVSEGGNEQTYFTLSGIFKGRN